MSSPLSSVTLSVNGQDPVTMTGDQWDAVTEALLKPGPFGLPRKYYRCQVEKIGRDDPSQGDTAKLVFNVAVYPDDLRDGPFYGAAFIDVPEYEDEEGNTVEEHIAPNPAEKATLKLKEETFDIRLSQLRSYGDDLQPDPARLLCPSKIELLAIIPDERKDTDKPHATLQIRASGLPSNLAGERYSPNLYQIEFAARPVTVETQEPEVTPIDRFLEEGQN